MLRKRIQELQTYRRLGLRSAGDIEKYDTDLAKRVRQPCHSSPGLIYLLTFFPRRKRGRRWLETGTPRSGPKGMGQDANHPSRIQGDQKDLNPSQNRAVKRTAPPPENLVRKPCKNKIKATAALSVRGWGVSLTCFIPLQRRL